jgi:hypothetical protein
VLTKRIVSAVLVGCCAGSPAAGQTVSDVLEFLVTNQSIQTGSIERDRAAAQSASDTISAALLANLATLPVTTSSGAFSYRLSPALGTVERSTRSFGPFFVERAQTAGRRTVSAGIALQRLRFTALDGRDLGDGSLVTTANQFTDESAPFDVDRLRMELSADVATVYANVGLTDRLDVAIAVPMVLLRLHGSRLNVYRERAFTQATASATAFGLADAVVRSKYLLVDRRGAALAGALDLRLPTGSRTNLLGAGSRSLEVTAVGSVERGLLSGHVNVGMTFGGLAPEVSYGSALALTPDARLTVIGEIVGRRIESRGRMTMASVPHPALAGVRTLRLVPASSNLHDVSIVPGFKWNMTDTWVLLGNVRVPLTHGGLTSPVAPFLGIDYGFGSVF